MVRSRRKENREMKNRFGFHLGWHFSSSSGWGSSDENCRKSEADRHGRNVKLVARMRKGLSGRLSVRLKKRYNTLNIVSFPLT